MSRKPDAVCAGGCGRDLWGGTTSLPAGERKCRACRKEMRESIFGKAKTRGLSTSKARRRRAKIKSAPSEKYTLAEIADRDNHICGICSTEVDMLLPGSDQYGPTIDHVVPLSKGGSDLKINVQVAHRYCNSAKGDRE